VAGGGAEDGYRVSSVVQPAFGLLTDRWMSTFLGLFVQQRVVHSVAASAVALFVLYAGGVVGTVLGGRMAVRWGRLRTLRVAYLAVAMAGVVVVPGPAVLVCIGAVSLALYVLLAGRLREPSELSSMTGGGDAVAGTAAR
jgi:predicted MFS family arabinose efflux permease